MPSIPVKIDSRESITEISKTWSYDVTDCTIGNCFAKFGFFVNTENLENAEDNDDITLEEL